MLKKDSIKEVLLRNNMSELSESSPDPLMIAKRENNETSALICALFAYGNARLIVRFLESLDFDLLNQSDDVIKEALGKHYYRFQNATDVQNLFIALKRLNETTTIQVLFMQGYEKEHNVLHGIFEVIDFLGAILPYESRGFRFLIGKSHQNSPYKRWLMYLRWMVRSDELDMGLWKGVDTKDLLLPLDTHTFKVGQTLGLLKRKSYDLKAVIEITASLQKFDKDDPIKYDFALYRLGQEKQL